MIATVPHKFGLAAQCATLTDRARFLGSVNVARRNADGTWHGDQVDGAAYVAAIWPPAVIPGRRVLQVGAGGAGSAIALALLESGAAELALHDADPERRDGLIARLRTRFGDRVVAGSDDPAGFDMVAHATPMGMRGRRPVSGGRTAAEAGHLRRGRGHQTGGAAVDRSGQRGSAVAPRPAPTCSLPSPFSSSISWPTAR